MKRPYTKMYMERKYRARRQAAVVVIITLTAIITMLLCPAGDRAAESVCVTQLDKKSAWAVQWSKDRGEYPYE